MLDRAAIAAVSLPGLLAGAPAVAQIIPEPPSRIPAPLPPPPQPPIINGPLGQSPPPGVYVPPRLNTKRPPRRPLELPRSPRSTRPIRDTSSSTCRSPTCRSSSPWRRSTRPSFRRARSPPARSAPRRSARARSSSTSGIRIRRKSLSANADWAGGAVGVDGITISVLPDETAILASLRAGQIDFALLNDPLVATLVPNEAEPAAQPRSRASPTTCCSSTRRARRWTSSRCARRSPAPSTGRRCSTPRCSAKARSPAR